MAARKTVRRMAARFDGTCIGCQKKFNVGDTIFWVRGTGAWHPDCTPDEVVEAARMNEVQRQERNEAEQVAEAKMRRDEVQEYVAKGGRVKPMTSKFAGKCGLCGGRIKRMDEIRWSKTTGALHVECWYEASGLKKLDDEAVKEREAKVAVVVEELKMKRQRTEELLRQIREEGKRADEEMKREQELFFKRRNEYLDLGWLNEWKETPEVVKRCREAGHKRDGYGGGPGCTSVEVICDECRYRYTVDSSG